MIKTFSEMVVGPLYMPNRHIVAPQEELVIAQLDKVSGINSLSYPNLADLASGEVSIWVGERNNGYFAHVVANSRNIATAPFEVAPSLTELTLEHELQRAAGFIRDYHLGVLDEFHERQGTIEVIEHPLESLDFFVLHGEGEVSINVLRMRDPEDQVRQYNTWQQYFKEDIAPLLTNYENGNYLLQRLSIFLGAIQKNCRNNTRKNATRYEMLAKGIVQLIASVAQNYGTVMGKTNHL
jgi:hypothetical protein